LIRDMTSPSSIFFFWINILRQSIVATSNLCLFEKDLF
jgi:hypothetical protein